MSSTTTAREESSGESSSTTNYLLIDIENAHLKKNHQAVGIGNMRIGKMDPFVVLSSRRVHASTTLSTEITRTPTHWDSHFEPAWFHECPRIPLNTDDDDVLVFCVYNDCSLGATGRKEMGQCQTTVKELLKQYHDRLKCSKSSSLGLGGDTKQQSCRILLPLSDENGTLTLQVKVREPAQQQQHTSSTNAKFTPVDPSWFESPVTRLGVSGGTAPFFKLQLTKAGMEATNQTSASYYIGKDLSHAEDEREFYEKILSIQANGEESTGVGLLTPFLFDYLGVLETKTTDSDKPCQLLVFQNLRNDQDAFRMLDLKMGQQTAVGGWQGKSRLRAMKQNVLDGMTNSTLEGYRLEGFDGQPERVESMDPLLDILAEQKDKDETESTHTDKVTVWGRKVSEKQAKKAKRMLFQTLTGADIFRFFADVHLQQQQPAIEDIQTQYIASEMAEIVMHELVTQLVRLAVTCHKVQVPQKWIGSSVALGFDCGFFPTRSNKAEAQIRSKVITNVFDWGRSELLTQRRYDSMTPAEQTDRQQFWTNYKDGMDRLAYNATREYYHHFTNSTQWTEVTLRVMDFDSLTADDYIGKVHIPLPDPSDTAAVQALQSSRPYELHCGEGGHGKRCGTVFCAISWMDCPAGSRLRGMWRVTVLYAKDLPAMDVNMSSDPYCIVVAKDSNNNRVLSQMTCVKTRTLNPQWNETVDIPVVQHARSLSKALAAEGVVLDFSPSEDVMDQEMGRLFEFQPHASKSGAELVQEWSAFLRKAGRLS
ncbi:Synaptotagmin-2 [Seminavis robusta]|uniref:Synaptotagmin-2 n=1 Tax=Seminavis robusta TaxID=568900 RepID=A0A9N8HHS5_9STRA|nr:Synaptotagmin-2 [Seminavis robusta]|eukprot:Sro553_g165340.1 Synaptotagmin-2 (764) ;mRNA; r:32324-34615